MLIEAAREHASRLRVDYLELRCNAPLDTDLQASVQKVSMTLELELDPERLWNGFGFGKHRTNIRRVYKDGLAVTGGSHELLPEFYSVMQRSWRDLGTPLYGPVLRGDRRSVSRANADLCLPPEQQPVRVH